MSKEYKRPQRSEREVAANLRTMRIVAASWTADAIVLTLLAHLSGTALSIPALYLAIGLGYASAFYFAIQRRYTERFADPTVSFPQLMIAVGIQCLGMWLAPEIGVFFLLNIFQVFAYGMFALSVRQFKALLGTVFCLTLATFVFKGHLISFPVQVPLGRFLLFVVFFVCLARFVWVALYVGKLRHWVFTKSIALADSEARFRALTELSSDWFWEQDSDLRFVRLESGAGGQALQEGVLLGKHPWESEFSIDIEGGWDAYRELAARRESFRDLVMRRVLPDRGEYFVSLSGGPILDQQGNFRGYRGVAREITEKRLAEERIRYLATHDSLTGLPNRMLFSQLIDAAIQSCRRSGRRFAVLFVDLDRFKLINDTLGHEAGDELLKEFATRLTQSLRASDIIARLGGDEFVILVQELKSERQAETVARKVLAAALKPVVLLGQECRVSASIGIALCPDDAEDSQSLLKNADSAMYLAKEEGKNNFQFYSQSISAHAHERITLENELRFALDRNEFELHYQVKRNLRTGGISGTEALLRWTNSRLGSVPPVQFIHMAEETGLIIPIGKWVLQTACAQNMQWQRQGLPPVCVAVNLSVRQFSDQNLLQDIDSILKSTGMPPHLLELEITEGMVVHNAERAIRTLHAIKAMGIRLAIDDFGTGYSSLSQLRDFPIDTLKIDRSFIRDVMDKEDDRALTQTIIAMARTLRLTSVAEGVETLAQETFLRESGCDEAQGFYISRPVPATEFAALLRANAETGKEALVMPG